MAFNVQHLRSWRVLVPSYPEMMRSASARQHGSSSPPLLPFPCTFSRYGVIRKGLYRISPSRSFPPLKQIVKTLAFQIADTIEKHTNIRNTDLILQKKDLTWALSKRTPAAETKNTELPFTQRHVL